MAERLVIAGGAGLLGQAVTAYFRERGRAVVVLHRGHVAAPLPEVRYVAWSGLPTDQPAGWEFELEGSAALINMAGRSVNCRYTAANRRAIMNSRILSTQALGRAIARCKTPPPLWINSSTATIYKHTYGPAHDESGVIEGTDEGQDRFSIEVATAWERAFFEPAVATRRVALRTAVVLSRRAGNVVPILRRLTRLGLGGAMGSGKQWVSWIHEADFCRAVAFVLEHAEISGPLNVAAPQPVTNAEMMRIFREVYGRRLGLPAARWMLEIGAFALRTETELLLKSRRVIPARLAAMGFAFEYPEFTGALRNLAQPTN